MSEPVANVRPSNIPVALRIILAVFCLLPIAIGLLAILVIFGSFIAEGFLFQGEERMWMQAFLAGAGFLAMPPAIVLGVILRYARWQRAPQASLVLAIIVAGATALASGMLQIMITSDDSESYAVLMMFSIIGIVTGALPPFLHWWKSRD